MYKRIISFAVFLGICLLLISLVVNAAPVAEAVGRNNVRVVLFSETGKICTGVAKRAQFIQADGTKIEGCWKAIPNGEGSIQMVFTDGDALVLPMDVFKKPEEV